MSEEEKRNRCKTDALDYIDRNAGEIAKLGDAVFYFAELGMQEFRTSEFTADALRKAGFDVEAGISGIPPAWMASWGSGEPVIGIHCEADAIPKSSQIPGITEERPLIEGGAPGHAEGHNTNIAVMIGAAVAAKAAMEKNNIKGTIKLFFAPAEEQNISRPYFLRDGYMDEIDAIFHPHVGKDLSTTYGIRQYGVISAEFTFHGKGAHSAVNPWLGRNALDAVVLMDVGWGMMRQQLEPSQRSHRVILNGGDQPNQIPSSTKAWWWFRDEHMDLANAHFEKAKKIAEGAAIMTGCTYETNVISTCWPTRANQAMAEMIQKNIEIVGMPRWSGEERRLAKEVQTKIKAPAVGLQTAIGPLKPAKQNTSCNDSGSVSWAIPTGRINLPTNIPGCPAHTWSAAVSLATSIAHKGEVAGAKVLAASMLDLFMDEGLLSKVKESFANEIGDKKYFNILPKEQKPPTDLNSHEMERWRPLMEKHYVREKVRWL